MLDNMAPELMRKAVAIINHRAVVEASGGIDETTLAAAAAAEGNVISVGALTHSVKALDISMDIGGSNKNKQAGPLKTRGPACLCL